MSFLVEGRALAAKDVLALISTHAALAQQGLSRQLPDIVLEAVQEASRPVDVRRTSGPWLKWYHDTDTTLQYVWDWFADRIAASQEPLYQVPHTYPAVCRRPAGARVLCRSTSLQHERQLRAKQRALNALGGAISERRRCKPVSCGICRQNCTQLNEALLKALLHRSVCFWQLVGQVILCPAMCAGWPCNPGHNTGSTCCSEGPVGHIPSS